MTLVVGTAGHIDHGKTALLQTLTGIDADRLPEERRRGMTIDVGYAHLDLEDGRSIDFVDVPGHDRLVGNMLVGAGEVDAALLVVALDDGPRDQTREHLELLDALRIEDGVVALTKADLAADDARRAEVIAEVAELLAETALAGSPIIVTSAQTGEGLAELRAVLVAMAERGEPHGRAPAGQPRLAVDRVFVVRGRGTVVTGSLRGGSLEPGRSLHVVPGGVTVRVREVQVHGQTVARAGSGRTALNLAGAEAADLRRGVVLTSDPGVIATDRLLVAVDPATELPGASRGRSSPGRDWPSFGESFRCHLGTEQVGAVMRRAGPRASATPDSPTVAALRLDRPVAARIGDRFALRRPSPGSTVGGGRVLDPRPPVGPSRRRVDQARLRALAEATHGGAIAAALLDLHGALPVERWRALGDAPEVEVLGPLVVGSSIRAELVEAALATVAAHHEADPMSAGIAIGRLRTALALALRRRVAAAPPAASGAAAALIDELATTGRLQRSGDRVRLPGAPAGLPPELAAAMARLEASLAVAAPPPFSDAARLAGCPPEGIRALETGGRIIRLEPELAFATTTYRELAARGVELSRSAPLTPAAFRDATGTSRRYALAILEDLGRRGVLRRIPEGHVPGPRVDVPGALP